jgi:cytochrome P450
VSATSEDVFAELSAELGSATVGDPYPVFAERRRTMPVMEGDIMTEFGLPAMAQSLDGTRPMYTLFRYDDIVGALRDPGTFSSSVIMDVFEPLLGRVVLGMDGAEHRSFRGLLMPAFTRRLLEIWNNEIIRPVARELVAELAPTKRANLVDFSLHFPVRMIYRILGFPNDQKSYDEFARAGLTMLLALSGVNPSNPEETARAIERAMRESNALYGSIEKIVEQRRAEGSEGDDFIGHLLRAEFEGERLNDDQIVTFVRSLLPAASETTTRTFLNVMTCLLERPAVMDQLRKDKSLIPKAINEANRLEAATTVLGRITTKEVELRGVRIPAGAGITLAAASGNRDEETFPDPDTFDLQREGPPGLIWGFGPHLCPGMNTARIEMYEAVDALLELLPNLRLDPSEEPPAIVGMMMRSPARLPVVWD